jgi:hypothetical protein
VEHAEVGHVTVVEETVVTAKTVELRALFLESNSMHEGEDPLLLARELAQW